jgi:hypothetical protein
VYDTLSQVTTEILDRCRAIRTQADYLALARSFANKTHREALAFRAWPFLNKRGAMTLGPPYTAGTIAGTQNTSTLTGTGTAWSSVHEGWYIKIGAQADLYRVTAVGSATSLSITPPLAAASLTGQTYKMFQMTYALPSDFRMPNEVDNFITTPPMGFVGNREFRRLIASLAQFDAPRHWTMLWDQQSVERTTIKTISGSVTISGTDTTAAVTFAEAQPDANYLIDSLSVGVGSGSPAMSSAWWSGKLTTGFTIELSGPPGAGTSVKVDWSVVGSTTSTTSASTSVPTPSLAFYPFAKDYTQVHYDYQIAVANLVDDGDLIVIPEDYRGLVVEGGMELIYRDVFDDSVRSEQAKGEKNRLIRQMANDYGFFDDQPQMVPHNYRGGGMTNDEASILRTVWGR